MLPFANLHRHSRWSLLDGTGSGEMYAAKAVELGQSSLALTDHGTLSGILEHIQACDDQGILPVCGVEVYFRANRMDHTKGNLPKFHLTLLALNYRGWLNLMRITSEAYESGFYMRPAVDWDLLTRYNEGVYCTTGCVGGMLPQLIAHGEQSPVDVYLTRMKSIFRDNLSVEIMPHDFDLQRQSNIGLINVAVDASVPVVATGDAHYPYKEWADTQDVMLMLSTGQSRKKRRVKQDAGEDIYTMLNEGQEPTLFLQSSDDMQRMFADYHPSIPASMVADAITHTTEIVAKVEPFLIDRDLKMPRLTRKIIRQIDPKGPHPDLSPGQAEEVDDLLVEETVARWCREGLDRISHRLTSSQRSVYEERVNYEIQTMKTGRNLAYMLMVAGEVRWARSQGIAVSPGRGSAAGSLVAYLTRITAVDPIAYGLIFERFLNPSRKGLPDIDVDFQPDKRPLVKDHTAEVYGRDCVMDIAAYGTYGPRKALKDACRVYDDTIDYVTATKYVAAIELKPVEQDTLEDCADRFEKIGEFKIRYPMIWKHAVRIEGHPFSQSSHASGTIVTPYPVSSYMPTATKSDKATGGRSTVTAWPDTHELLASHGFLKIDYLVIEGLSRQAQVLEAMSRRGQPLDLDSLEVTHDPYAVDPAVMEAFGRGDTLGVWQFEGQGTIPVLKAVQPENMHDVAAINALIRPGARGGGITDEYARRKHHLVPESEWYWHESVEPILKRTYGLLVFQEQAMSIVVELGGFTYAEADDFRKAMGKKYREGMRAVTKFLRDLGYESKFIHNASSIVGEDAAGKIWKEKLLPLGAYVFNASHAYAYGLVSYYDGLLKHLAPADFYASLLSSTSAKDLPWRLAEGLREGKKRGLAMNPPDVNKSGYGFSVLDPQNIAFGIDSIKGVGPASTKAIFEHRPYLSYQDFDDRVPKRNANKRVKEALVAAGAFDCFGLRDLLTPEEKAEAEQKTLGMRISADALYVRHEAMLEETIHSEREFDEALDGAQLCVGGEIAEVKTIITKGGDEMAWVNLQWGKNSYRAVFFPGAWSTLRSQLQDHVGEFVLLDGRKQVSDRFGDGFVASDLMTLESLLEKRGVPG